MTIAVAIGLLAVVSYGLRAGGLLLPDDHPILERFADPLTAGILASLVITSTFGSATTLNIDARFVGLIVAAVSSLARLPLTVTLLLAVTATALVRLVG